MYWFWGNREDVVRLDVLIDGVLLWMGISVGKCMVLGVGCEGRCSGGNVIRS